MGEGEQGLAMECWLHSVELRDGHELSLLAELDVVHCEAGVVAGRRSVTSEKHGDRSVAAVVSTVSEGVAEAADVQVELSVEGSQSADAASEQFAEHEEVAVLDEEEEEGS